MNTATYPGLTAAYSRLGVALEPSDMSFNAGGIRHSGELTPYLRWMTRDPKVSPDHPSCLWSLLTSQAFFSLIYDKYRFHHKAREALLSPMAHRGETIGEFMRKEAFGHALREYWLDPFIAAVWSIPNSEVSEFDLIVLLQFMNNHGFLSWGAHQWLTPKGRAQAEVDAFQVCGYARRAWIHSQAYFKKHDAYSALCNVQVERWDPHTHSLHCLHTLHGATSSLVYLFLSQRALSHQVGTKTSRPLSWPRQPLCRVEYLVPTPPPC